MYSSAVWAFLVFRRKNAHLGAVEFSISYNQSQIVAVSSVSIDKVRIIECHV